MTTDNSCSIQFLPREAGALLAELHRRLIAHRYDAAQGEQLNNLIEATPEAEEYYQTGNASLRPVSLTVVDALMRLTEAEVCEALCLGFLVGRVKLVGNSQAQTVDDQAQTLIECLGLQDLMAYNLSFGYVTTERATAALQDMVAR